MVAEKPDGRWGWMVVFAAAMIRIMVYGVSYTSGVVYVVMLDVFQKSKGETAWVASLIGAVMYLSCTLSSYFVQRFGTRIVAFAGGLLASIGLVVSAFAVNIEMLCLFYGIVAGAGCGLTFIPSSVAVSTYFTKRRTMALAVASSGGGIGTFLFPPLIKYLEMQYGWRGMFLILGGIALNICVFAMLYRPIQKTAQPETLLNSTLDVNEDHKRKMKKWRFCFQLEYQILLLNNFLYGFGSSTVFGHLQAFGKFQWGIEETKAAMVYSAIGVSVTLVKLAHGFLTQHPKIRPVYLYILFYCLGGVATLFLFIRTDIWGLAVYGVVFGASYAANGGCLVPAICIEIAGLDQLSFSYGIVFTCMAVGHLLGPPAAGFMVDRMRSYDAVIVMAALSMLIAGVIMVIPCHRMNHPEQNKDIEIEIKLEPEEETLIHKITPPSEVETEAKPKERKTLFKELSNLDMEYEVKQEKVNLLEPNGISNNPLQIKEDSL